MPIDPITAAATVTAIGNTANAAATGKQNKKSRQFSRETYAKTKADNIAFWQMQNEYNSPESQMARLKKAGLNPNMVYDKGGAVQPAGNISTPDVQGAQFRTPDFGSVGTGLVQGYFDTRIKQAQYDNLKAQNSVYLQDAVLKAAQAAGEVSRTEGQGVSNLFSKSNLNNALEKATLETKKVGADLTYTIDENMRKAAMQAPNLEIAAQTLLKMKAETATTWQQKKQIEATIDNLKQDNRLKAFEEKLASEGIYKWDPLWARALIQFIEGLTGEEFGPNKLGKEIKEWADVPYKRTSGSTLDMNTGVMHYFYNKFKK
jgi:hypothetical protein